jgi:hypothetical protein
MAMVLKLDDLDDDGVWTSDEELRTITCFNHDPICDHCSDFCQSILKNEKFLPRYSHGGHSGTDELSAKKSKNMPIASLLLKNLWIAGRNM